LSHCWGARHGLLKTIKDVLHLHKECIFERDLLKTFRDAIVFTRQLGIRYLWIDSLCITKNESERNLKSS
jgi:hypothetical protein